MFKEHLRILCDLRGALSAPCAELSCPEAEPSAAPARRRPGAPPPAAPPCSCWVGRRLPSDRRVLKNKSREPCLRKFRTYILLAICLCENVAWSSAAEHANSRASVGRGAAQQVALAPAAQEGPESCWPAAGFGVCGEAGPVRSRGPVPGGLAVGAPPPALLAVPAAARR